MYPNQQNNPTDHTANFFWLLVLICLGLIGLWYFKPGWVIAPVFWLRRIELDFMILGAHLWNSVAHYIHLPSIHTNELLALKSVVSHVNPKTFHFREFETVNGVMGDWLRWPVMGVLLVLAVIAYFRHSTMMFRQRYNMNTLKELERENWPQIEPVLSLNLVKEDIEKGPWSMAKVPLDYCKENKIIKIEEKEGKKIWAIEKGPAARLLTMQLGPLWKDLFNLPIHIKALIVIFVAHAQRNQDISKHFLKQIAGSAASGKLDFTGVNEQLMQYQNAKILSWLRPRHAYVRTMMASLLEVARANGVLATAEFLWLKPVDRKLWYMLNSVGRQTAVVEVSGIFAHWKAEKALGRAMTTPMVKEAVKALDFSVQNILYVSGEDRWHSSGA